MSVIGEKDPGLENQITNSENVKDVDGKDSPTTEIQDERKHQLHNEWKFWYFENVKERNWEDNLRVVSPFCTVEDFWSIYNHIKSASDIRNGCSYFVFKDGLKPMWEDEGNRRGGRWLINFDRKHRNALDEKWLEVLLCLIGEAFDVDGDEICGAVVDVRNKVDKISVWTADCRNKERILSIGRKLKERLNLAPQELMVYESHVDTQTKTSSSAKHIYSL